MAGGPAAIPSYQVSVVAAFSGIGRGKRGQRVAIATDRGHRRRATGVGAFPAQLDSARFRAAVVVCAIVDPSIAAFGPLFDPVAADRSAAGGRTVPARLLFALAVAAVAVHVPAIVAFFTRSALAIAAELFDTGLPRSRTPVVDLVINAVEATWISQVATVAFFSALPIAVSTLGADDARLTRPCASKPGLDCLAVSIATVPTVRAIDGVSVIAGLFAFNHAVATNDGENAGLAFYRTIVVRVLDQAVR